MTKRFLHIVLCSAWNRGGDVVVLCCLYPIAVSCTTAYGEGWAIHSELHYESDGAPKVESNDALIAGGLSQGGALKFIGGVDEHGRPLPGESANRHNLWEVRLPRGKYDVRWIKRPAEDGVVASEHYVTVSLGKRTNLRYITAARRRLDVKVTVRGGTSGIIGFPDFPIVTKTVVEEQFSQRLSGGLAERGEVLNNTDGLLVFELESESVVFIQTHRAIYRDVPAGRKKKGLLDPGPREKKYVTVREDFRCPMFLRWVPDAGVYQLEVEAYIGEFDLQDWSVAIAKTG